MNTASKDADWSSYTLTSQTGVFHGGSFENSASFGTTITTATTSYSGFFVLLSPAVVVSLGSVTLAALVAAAGIKGLFLVLGQGLH